MHTPNSSRLNSRSSRQGARCIAPHSPHTSAATTQPGSATFWDCPGSECGRSSTKRVGRNRAARMRLAGSTSVPFSECLIRLRLPFGRKERKDVLHYSCGPCAVYVPSVDDADCPVLAARIACADAAAIQLLNSLKRFTVALSCGNARAVALQRGKATLALQKSSDPRDIFARWLPNRVSHKASLRSAGFAIPFFLWVRHMPWYRQFAYVLPYIKMIDKARKEAV